MAFQDDWILRQVEMIARFVAHLIFHKEEVSYVLPSSGVLTETDELYLTLQRLLREGAVCEAEDLLFENMVPTDRYIELATDFYVHLNEMSDQELEQADFSREEVYDGYIEILTRMGVPVEQFAR